MRESPSFWFASYIVQDSKISSYCALGPVRSKDSHILISLFLIPLGLFFAGALISAPSADMSLYNHARQRQGGTNNKSNKPGKPELRSFRFCLSGKSEVKVNLSINAYPGDWTSGDSNSHKAIRSCILYH